MTEGTSDKTAPHKAKEQNRFIHLTAQTEDN
jgi:hypothetical protein